MYFSYKNTFQNWLEYNFFYKLHAMYLITYFKDLYLKLLVNSAKSTQDNLGFSRAFPAAYAL